MLPTLWYKDRMYSSDWMDSEINRVLAGLNALGCGPGDTVAAMLRNSPQYVAVVLACRRAGLYLASVNWHFKATDNFASRGQKQIYHGLLKPLEQTLLRTKIVPWAYLASRTYYDGIWYPFIGKRRTNKMLKTKWGKLFQEIA